MGWWERPFSTASTTLAESVKMTIGIVLPSGILSSSAEKMLLFGAVHNPAAGEVVVLGSVGVELAVVCVLLADHSECRLDLLG